MLNNLKGYKQQADALVGLALHILQDHFAHKTKINVVEYTKRNGKKVKSTKYKTGYSSTQFSTDVINDISKFEDDTGVFKWRHRNARAVTYVISDLYSKNRKIVKIEKRMENTKKSMWLSHTVIDHIKEDGTKVMTSNKHTFKITTKEFRLVIKSKR